MADDYADKVKDVLSRHGYRFARHGKGSHDVWTKKGQQSVSVPQSIPSRFTANGVLKDALVPKEEWIK
jgi:predicted RNA binding protein YcfA (HicA-like mRNA interferase family)